MKKFLKDLIETAKAEGAEIHVVRMNADELCDEVEPKKDAEPDFVAEVKKEAAEIAHLNRILYEAHLKAGFTNEEALALTVATIKNK